MAVLPTLLSFILFWMNSVEADSSFFPPHFSRYRWHATTLGDGWLFADGGEIYSLLNGSTTFYLADSTLAFNLSESWSNSTVTPSWTSKPGGYPLSRNERLWYNPVKHMLQTYGGWQYDSDNCGTNDTWRADGRSIQGNLETFPAKAWQLKVGQKNGMWEESPEQPPMDITWNQGALVASTEDKLYSLGGFSVIDDGGFASPGMAILDFATGKWTNKTYSDAENPVKYTADGQAIYIPSYGTKGIIVFFGGYAPPEQLFTYSSDTNPLQSMGNILIYDIANDKFTQQLASGKVPPSRWGFCSAGVKDHGHNEFDIFIFGGCATTEGSEFKNNQLADIYALSLPSFRWTVIPNTTQQMRCLPKCNTIGNRQMFVFGGDNPMSNSLGITYDPWYNAINIFDMAALNWSTNYDATALPYQRNSLLIEATKHHPYPSNFNSYLKTLFKLNTTTTASSTLSTGAIAAIVVGAVLLVALLILTALLVRRQHRRKLQRAAERREKFNAEYRKPELPDNSVARPSAPSLPSRPPGIEGWFGADAKEGVVERSELDAGYTRTEMETREVRAEQRWVGYRSFNEGRPLELA